jgi:hypothetical protein
MAAQGRATKEKSAPEKTTPSSRTSGQRGRQTRSRASGDGRGATVPVPVVTPHLKVYRFHLPKPDMSYVSDAGQVVAGYLPPPDRLAFYGGLGIAAVVGLIDWPVATAIGIGTMIARRATRSRGEAPGGRSPQRTTGRS